jgi:hypothetical protein
MDHGGSYVSMSTTFSVLGDRDEHSRREERVNYFVALSKLDKDLVWGGTIAGHRLGDDCE